MQNHLTNLSSGTKACASHFFAGASRRVLLCRHSPSVPASCRPICGGLSRVCHYPCSICMDCDAIRASPPSSTNDTDSFCPPLAESMRIKRRERTRTFLQCISSRKPRLRTWLRRESPFIHTSISLGNRGRRLLPRPVIKTCHCQPWPTSLATYFL